MSLRMLGGMHLEVAGKTATAIKTERLQCLFAFLALHRAHPLRRDYVAFILWPDCTEPVSRRRLRKALHDLRTALPILDHFISIDAQSIHWLPETVVQIDVEVFEHALAAASRVEREGRLADAARHIETAIDLYSGDLLPENYHEWFALRRRQLHNQFIDAMQSISLLMERSTEYDKSIAYIKTLLRHESDLLAAHSEELHEATFSRLIRLSGRRLARGDVEWAYRMYAYNRSRYDMPVSAQIADEYEAALLRASKTSGIVVKAPPRVTPFLGRRREIAEIGKRLADRRCRLLTVAGVAGVGKTSVAQQIAHELDEFVHGVYFVAARTAQSEEQLLRRVAEVLDLSPSPEMSTQASILRFAADKRLLLILDNYEHLADHTDWLIDLLEQAPSAKVLVTSRIRLNRPCEWIYELSGLPHRPLDAPPDGDEVDEDASAVELFRLTAQRVSPDFDPSTEEHRQIVRICELVEGLPLAIELAATWVRLFSCQEIADRFVQGIEPLIASEGSNDHHGMRAALDYSWDLLSSEEQRMFLGICTFRGGFDADSAMAVGAFGMSTLVALIDSSFVRRTGDERYDIHNLLYQYGQMKLHQNPALRDELYAAHCQTFTALIDNHTQELMAGQTASILRIRPDLENIIDAWHWAVDHDDDETLSRLCLGTSLFLYELSLFNEGIDLYRKAMEAWTKRDANLESAKVLMAKLQTAYSCLAQLHGDFQIASMLLDAAEPVIEAVGLEPERAMAHAIRGMNAFVRGKYDVAERQCLIAQVLAQPLRYFSVWGGATIHLGDIERVRGRFAAAERHYTHSLTEAKRLHSVRGEGISLWRLGANALAQNRLVEAGELSREALAIAEAANDYWVRQAILAQLGDVAVRGRAYDDSARHYCQALEITAEGRGSTAIALDAILGLCTVLAHSGRAGRAYHYLAMVLAHTDVQHQTLAAARSLADQLGETIPGEEAHLLQLRGQVKPLNVAIAELLLI